MERKPRLYTRKDFLRMTGGVFSAAALAACGAETKTSVSEEPTPATVEATTSPVAEAPVVIMEAPTPTPEVSPFAENPTWSIDFSTFANNETLNPQIWNFEEGNTVAGYNKEEQTYTSRPENVRVEDGALVIQARKEDLNDRHYTSARINTKGNMDMTYGKLVVNAKLPQGIGTWPAIWLRTSEFPYTTGATEEEKKQPHFTQRNGEIDIMEAQGARPGLVFSNAHSLNSLRSGDMPHQVTVEEPTMYSDFHAYGVEWTPDSIRFTNDGEVVKTIQKDSDNPDDWPFDHGFHLVMNLAIGGEWAESLKKRLNLPDSVDDSHEADWKLYIKNINYYPLKTDN